MTINTTIITENNEDRNTTLSPDTLQSNTSIIKNGSKDLFTRQLVRK